MLVTPKLRCLVGIEIELERIAHTACVIAGGFYETSGIVVLPSLENKYTQVQAIFPRENYAVIPYFWERIRGVVPEFPLNISRKLREDMGAVFDAAKLSSISPKYAKMIETDWKKISRNFWKEIARLFPLEAEYVGEIEIRLSKWGTISSYSYLKRGRKQKLTIYIREDAGISEIAESIIASMLCPDRNNQGFHWNQREAIVDFVMSRPFFEKMFPDYKPTLSGLMKVDETMRKKSHKFLREIGIKTQVKVLHIKDHSVMIDEESIDKHFGVKEIAILKLLVENIGKITSNDQLADKLWGEGEFKSFWALNKIVERLRHKLIKLGIDGCRLESVRGQGYILNG